MIPSRIANALNRIDWERQNIRLRKVLTSSLIAPLIVIIGPAVDLVTAPAANAAGSGITFWFNNFTSIPAARTTITSSTTGFCRTETSGINYTWGTGQPSGCASNGEKFAGYGLGRISALSSSSKTYQFCVEADDGVIVEIAGTAVIDDWNDQGAISCTSNSGNAATNGTFTFAGNTTYEIKVWYYENGGGADLRLFWRENSTGTYAVVDNKYLATSDTLLKPSISLPSTIIAYDYGNTTYNFGPGDAVSYLVSGGTSPYSYSLAPGSASLPTILALNSSTGSIVYNAGGSQTKSTTTGLKIRVTDANGMFADSGNFQVTVNPVIPATYPTTATSTIGGFTFTIQNFDSTLTYTGTTSVGGGTVSVNGTSGLVTVTGLGVGVSSTVTLTAAKSGEQSKSSTSPSYSSTPKITLTTPGSLSATATPNVAKSFSVTWSDVSNESSYQLTVLEGSTTRATISLSANSTSRTITTSDFSGMQDGTQYTVNLVAVGDGSQYDSSTAASTTITTNQTARTATFGTGTRQPLGFTAPISNYDNTFTYETATASAGSASLVGSNIVVTGLTRGAGATVTISTRKSGFLSTTTTSGMYYALETATALTLTAKTLTVGAPYKILYSADANNPNKPTYASSTTGICTVAGETITPLAAGTCSISATLVGYSTYDTTTASNNFTVSAKPTVSSTNSVVRTFGQAQTFTDLTTTSGTGPFTYNVVRTSDSQTVTGVYAIGARIYFDTLTAAMFDTFTAIATDSNGVSASTNFTLRVFQATPTFSISSDLTNVAYGRPVVITITAGSSLVTGTFTLKTNASYITNLTGCENVTFVNGSATCTWIADSYSNNYAIVYSGNTNYSSGQWALSGGPLVAMVATLNYFSISKEYGTTMSYSPRTFIGGAGPTSTWTWSIVKTSDSSTVPGIFMNYETITVMDTTTIGSYNMTVVSIDASGSQTSRTVSITVTQTTGLTAVFDSATSTAGGFTFNITNYNVNFTFTPSVTAGSISLGSPSGSVLPVTVSGLADSATATATITTSRLYHTTIATTTTARSLGSGINPSFGTVTKTSTGFTVTISNYSASYSWTESVTAGTVSAGAPSGSNRTYTVTGLSPGQSATLYVTDTSTTTKSVTGFITGSAKSNQNAITLTTTSGNYPSETLTVTGGSGTGALTFSLAGPATTTVGTTKISETITAGAYSFYSPDGSMLYILNGKSPNSNMLRFNVSSKVFLSAITLPANSKQMAIAPSGNFILVASPTQVTKILTSTGETSTVLTDSLANFAGISIDPTGSDDFYLSDSSNRKILGYQSNGTSKFATTLTTNANSASTSFGRLGIIADGSKLYVLGTGADSTIYEFNTSSGAKTREFFMNSVTGLTSLAVTPDGRFAFAGHSTDGRMYGVDLRDSARNSLITLYQNYNVNNVAVTPDSAYVFASVSESYNGYWSFRRYEAASFINGLNSSLQLSTNTFGTPAATAIAPDSKSGYLIYTSGIVPLTLDWGAGTSYCSISGTTISAKSAGTCTVLATKAADLDFNGETSTATTFTFSAVPALKVAAVGGNVNYSSTSLYNPTNRISGFVRTDTATITNVSYTYFGINGTTYASSSAKPTAVGTYSVTPAGGSVSFTSGYRAGYVIPNVYLSDTLTVLATVSDSVTAVLAVATSSTTASISFTAPAVNKQGGSSVTSYVVSNGTDTVTASSTSSPITVSGLSPGTAYVFRVNAINSVGRSDTATAASIRMPLGVTISPATTTATFGVPITAIVPTVRGGSGITYTITPALPAGLTLNLNGSITGTPTETSTVKTYTETATATGTSGTATFTLSVINATSSISVPTITPVTPVMGSPITFTSTVTSNTQATLTGTISFKNAANVELCATSTLSAGVGSCDYTPITTDTFTVRAFFSGMTYVDTSTSVSALTVVPTKGNPSVTLAATPLNVVLGSSTVLTTTISTGTATNATGQVSYTSNSIALTGCSAVNVTSNAAGCTFTPTTTGIFPVLATYVGDSNYNGVVASSINITVSSCTQSQTGLTLATGAPTAGYCAVSITAGTSGSLGLPVGVIEMKSRVMIIGGGGSGGTRAGAGGGAGSLLYSDSLTVTDTRTVTIGAGGRGFLATNHGESGGSTTYGIYVASGGGGGANNASTVGYNGGSGGGGAGNNGGTAGSASQTSYSGFRTYAWAGGIGTSGSTGPAWTGGGGGGAGGAGGNGTANSIGGTGGRGLAMDMTLTGAYACFAAGGGGGADYPKSGGPGGSCTGNSTAKVGGDGSAGGSTPDALAGAANTGSGGGGGGFGVSGDDQVDTGRSGAGGTGLVALRYISPAVITVPADTSTASLTTLTFVATAPLFGNLFTRSYQWQRWDSTTAGWVNDTTTVTATTLTYTFVARYGLGSSQRIRLIVTDSDGTLITKSASRTITLTVTPLVQPTLVIASTYAIAGTSIKLFTTGGGGTGAVTYTYVSTGSAAGCSLSAGSLSLSLSGICKVIATKAADNDYLVKVSDTATVSFVAFQMTVQQAPTNTSTGIFTSGSTTTNKGSNTCSSGCVPTISSISVSTGIAGQTLSITITGTNFTGATKVTFNGTIQATTFSVNSDTQIAATMPATVPAGEVGIDVTTPGGISARNYDLELTA